MPQREPRWLELARAEIGVLEKAGPEANPKVLAFFREVGHEWVKDDATAWCGAFEGAIFKRAGIAPPPPSKVLGARNWESWGERLDQPALGCVGVKRRTDGQAWQGHVGFVVAASPTTIWMLGGNQADSVSIAPFSRWQFTAFRWPSGEPRTAMALPASAGGKSGSEA